LCGERKKQNHHIHAIMITNYLYEKNI